MRLRGRTGARLSALRRRKEWRAVQHTPSTFRFPRGESFTEMQARCWGAVVEPVSATGAKQSSR